MVTEKQLQGAESLLSVQLLNSESDLSTETIEDTVRKFKNILFDLYGFEVEDLPLFVRRLETKYQTTMELGVSLVDQDAIHDTAWYQNRDITWDYWNDYSQHLIRQGWPPRVLNTMDLVTNKALGLVQDPQQPGEWDRRGLVIGHVQSGKTANYIGLITKAADAGYKFIIVIAGIHNTLRTQTQQRIDEGFIGRDSESRTPIGVGIGRNSQRETPATVTTTLRDFNSNIARQFNMELQAFRRTFILVIKKNASTLRNLYRWLKELNSQDQLARVPMLLIDDEADNASINTNKPELDPTRINREIRSILNLFSKRSYVGYTATPFASIFIDPEGDSEDYGQDLFPKDFIYCLDAPSNYFGTDKVFLNEELSERFVREIKDADDYVPLNHKRHFVITDLPPSLKSAIRVFVLARAIRNLRGQKSKHTSMMINASRFVAIQRQVKELVVEYLSELQKSIRYNYRLSERLREQNALMVALYEDFVAEFGSGDETWDAVLDTLSDAADSVTTVVINTGSEDVLDYKSHEQHGDALTVIAIGGLALSRGLTLEGLCVSYIYRNSKLYDTLLQMGRWFGFRDGYEDLCRIFMSDASRGWYEHIARATDELRQQVKQMIRDRKKPVDFPLYVMAHPDTLEVTSANKMRFTGRELRLSYDGKLVETFIIPDSQEKNESNRTLLKSFYDDLAASRDMVRDDNTGSILFRDVSTRRVEDVVSQFQMHDDLLDRAQTVPRFIREIADLYPRWDVVFRSLKSRTPENGYMIASQVRTIGQEPVGTPRLPLSEGGWYVGNKNRFSDNRSFSIGLSTEQLNRADALAADVPRSAPIYSDFTNARNKPILIFHLLDLVLGEKDNEPPIIAQVPAISVSFPVSSEFRTIEYIANPVALRSHSIQFDSAFEEEDLDYDR